MNEANKAMKKVNSSVAKFMKVSNPIRIMPITKEELQYAPDPKKIKDLYR
jgi:hypothetical protein